MTLVKFNFEWDIKSVQEWVRAQTSCNFVGNERLTIIVDDKKNSCQNLRATVGIYVTNVTSKIESPSYNFLLAPFRFSQFSIRKTFLKWEHLQSQRHMQLSMRKLPSKAVKQRTFPQLIVSNQTIHKNTFQALLLDHRCRSHKLYIGVVVATRVRVAELRFLKVFPTLLDT